jgi:hypothetical protein
MQCSLLGRVQILQLSIFLSASLYLFKSLSPINKAIPQ